MRVFACACVCSSAFVVVVFAWHVRFDFRARLAQTKPTKTKEVCQETQTEREQQRDRTRRALDGTTRACANTSRHIQSGVHSTAADTSAAPSSHASLCLRANPIHHQVCVSFRLPAPERISVRLINIMYRLARTFNPSDTHLE